MRVFFRDVVLFFAIVVVPKGASNCSVGLRE